MSGPGVCSTITGATTWTDHGLPLNFSGNHNAVSGGSPDVVWGPGNKVYAVELGRDQSDQSNPCAAGAGLYLSVSANSGATWNTILLVANGQNQVLAMLKEFASKDMPGRQESIAETASKILAIVSEPGSAHGASPA